jgi:hypothetical protein
MPAPSPLFRIILELVLCNGLQSCRRITHDVTDVIKIPSFQYFLYLREQKSHWGQSRWIGYSGTVIRSLAKNSFTDSDLRLAPLGPFLHISSSFQDIQLTFFCFSVDVRLLCYAPDSQPTIFTHNLRNFCNVFFIALAPLTCTNISLISLPLLPSLTRNIMFVLTFSRRHTKTHSDNNRRYSERDYHRSNHTEVSIHCCHGKHMVASSRTLLSDLVYK